MRTAKMSKKDLVGDEILTENANWTFSDEVSEKFDSHVSKSVPLYGVGHELIGRVSDFFLRDNSICYDLGCSTGELLWKLSQHVGHRKVRFIGLDCEKDMIRKAQEKCSELERVEFLETDFLDFEFEKSDLIVSYYSMQFVPPRSRQLLFDRIYESLNWGGGFILFEKVRAPDARLQDMMTAIYTDFKLDQGYTSEEIVAKTRSLKGVLEPFSTSGNLDLLKRAGFQDIMTIMKYVCFEGFLAIK
jgi:tRNA (cmo5U34)-methyltransferase